MFNNSKFFKVIGIRSLILLTDILVINYLQRLNTYYTNSVSRLFCALRYCWGADELFIRFPSSLKTTSWKLRSRVKSHLTLVDKGILWELLIRKFSQTTGSRMGKKDLPSVIYKNSIVTIPTSYYSKRWVWCPRNWQ